MSTYRCSVLEHCWLIQTKCTDLPHDFPSVHLTWHSQTSLTSNSSPKLISQFCPPHRGVRPERMGEESPLNGDFFFLNEYSDYPNSSSYSEVNFSWNYIEVGDEMPAYCLNFHNSETSTSCDRHHLPVAIAIAFHNSAVSWRGAIVCQSSGLK